MELRSYTMNNNIQYDIEMLLAFALEKRTY